MLSDRKLGEGLGTRLCVCACMRVCVCVCRGTYQAAVTKVGKWAVLHSHLDGFTRVQGTLVLSPSYLPIEGLHICGRLKANNTFRDQ